jgi:hypothetical protein
MFNKEDLLRLKAENEKVIAELVTENRVLDKLVLLAESKTEENQEVQVNEDAQPI